MLGFGCISHYTCSEYALSSTLSVYGALIAIEFLLEGIIMLLSYATVNFHLFNDGAAAC